MKTNRINQSVAKYSRNFFVFGTGILPLAVLFGLAINAVASTFTWQALSGGNASGSWTNSASWSGGTLPTTTADTVNFGTLDITSDSTVTLDNNQSANTLIFGDQSPGDANWIVSQGLFPFSTLTMGGTGPSITVSNIPGKAAIINATIAGSVNWAKNEAGTLTLAGQNSFTGGFTLNAGQINFNTSGAIGSGAETINGGTMDNTSGSLVSIAAGMSLNGDFTLGGSSFTFFGGNNTLTMNANRIITVNGSCPTYTMAGFTIIAGAYTLTKSGPGTLLQLGNKSTYSGGTVITGGIFGIHTESASGASDLGTVPTSVSSTNIIINGATLLTCGTLTLNSNRWINLGNSSGGGGTLDVVGGTTLTYYGTITNNGTVDASLTKAGSGALTLGGTNTYSGATTVARGTLTADFSQPATVPFNILSTNALTLGGGTLALKGKASTANVQTNSSLSVSGGGNTITLTAGAGAGASVAISLGNIARTGVGGLVDFSYSGASNPTNFYYAGNANGLIGGWATVNSFNEWASLSNGVVWPLGNYGGYTVTIPSSVGDSTANYQITSGGISNLTGNVAMNSLRLGNGSGIALGANNLTFSSTNGGLLSYGNSSVSGSGYLTAGSGNELIIITRSGANLTNSAPLIGNSDTGSLTVGGAGTVLLRSVNNYTGPTLVNGGTLTLLSGGSLASPVKVNTGGTLTVSNGATISTNIEVGPASGNTAVNFNNSGTVQNVTIDAGDIPYAPANTLTGGAASAAPGYALLRNSSITGTVTNNGILAIDAGATVLNSVGTVYSPNGIGSIIYNSTSSNLLTLAHGNNFSTIAFASNTVAAFAVDNGTGTVGVAWFGYPVNNGAQSIEYVTLNGGTWNVNIGQNNGNEHFDGTATLVSNTTVNVLNNGGYSHGTWNVRNGQVNFYGNVASGAVATGNIGLNLMVPDSGSGPAAVNVYNGNCTLGAGAINNANALETNTIMIQNGGAVSINGNLTLDTVYAHNSIQSNVLTLAAGKLVVSGTLAAGSGTSIVTNASPYMPASPMNLFNWTGGQLTVGTLTVSNGLWIVGTTNSLAINNKYSTNPAVIYGSCNGITLTNSAGIMAPGDIGVAGKTTINGSYAQTGSSILNIDIFGTTQASSFQHADTTHYDFLSVSNGAQLGGSLVVNLQNSYAPPATAAFNIVQTLNGTTISGSFTNLTGVPSGSFMGKVVVANATNATFDVYTNVSVNALYLTNYTVSGSTPAPVASFSGTPLTGIRPLTVTFTNTSTGNFTNGVWNFGDGSTLTTASLNFTHTYTTNGVFTVSLTAEGVGGTNMATTNNYITVTVPASPNLTSVAASGGSLIFQGHGGPTGGGYYYWLLSSTNLTLPRAQWSIIATNPFNADGSFSNSVTIPLGNPENFYLLQMP